MSSRSWQEPFQAELQKLRANKPGVRVALLGIGHELCGDDAVGMRIAALARPLLAGNEQTLVIEAGPAPENFTAPLRRFQPDLVVLLDSAAMDGEPGCIRWLNWQDSDTFSASTHTLPLNILASYLITELGCAIGLIGVQPAQTFADAPLTPLVQQAAEDVARILSDYINTEPGIVPEKTS